MLLDQFGPGGDDGDVGFVVSSLRHGLFRTSNGRCVPAVTTTVHNDAQNATTGRVLGRFQPFQAHQEARREGAPFDLGLQKFQQQ